MFILIIRISAANGGDIPFQNITTKQVQCTSFSSLQNSVYEFSCRGNSIKEVSEVLNNLDRMSKEGIIDSEFQVTIKNLH